MSNSATRAANARRIRQMVRDNGGPRKQEHCYGKCGRFRLVESWSPDPYYCDECRPLPTEPVYAGAFSPAKPELHRINVDDWRKERLSLNRRVKESAPGEVPGPYAFMAECGEYVFINSMRKYEPDEIANKPRCGVCFGRNDGN